MNITEAHEELLAAAQSMLTRAEQQGGIIRNLECTRKLRRAVQILTPRVRRMRARLNDQRARRAGTPNCPKWAAP